MSTFPVDIEFRGLAFEAHCEAEPYRPANRRGHPDNWTPAEGGDFSVYALTRAGKNWSFLLRQNCAEITAIAIDAYAAWCEWQAEP